MILTIAWEKTSQGVLYSKHFLDRLFIKSVALNRSFSVTLCKGIFFGKNCLSKKYEQAIVPDDYLAFKPRSQE